jgi:hypothetical protein
MDQLAIAIKLLLDDSEQRFTYERQLRMFQFQCWLLDTWKQESSFRQSAVRFGCAVLSSEISRVRSSNRGLGTRDCFLLAIAGKNMEQIINRSFARHGHMYDDIYDLMRVDRLPIRKWDHDDAVAIIEKLNTVLEVRLRLRAADQSWSLAKTWEMLPKLAKGIGRETTLKPLRRARRQRQPFLYAAKRVAPEFLTMNFEKTVGPSKFITADGLLSQMAEKARNREAFRKLCGAAKAIAEVIQGDVKWSKEMVSALANVEGELPAMEPIPAELLPQKAPRPPRRGATETKKAARQRIVK